MRVAGLVSVVAGVIAYIIAEKLINDLVIGTGGSLRGELPLAHRARIAKENQSTDPGIFK